MKIVCIGGGPAGLYFALLMKQRDPKHDISVVERNKPYDTFGWGVVFSDATMDNMREWDRETADAIEASFAHWDDIELQFKGRTIRSGGHGFVGIGRKKLLNILQARCEQLGVELIFDTEAGSDEDYPDADLIIASDGVNSRVRRISAAWPVAVRCGTTRASAARGGGVTGGGMGSDCAENRGEGAPRKPRATRRPKAVA